MHCGYNGEGNCARVSVVNADELARMLMAEL